MKRPRVFIMNESGHDFSAAEEFGDLVFITKGQLVGRQLNKHFRAAEKALRDFSSDDFILCTSLQLLNFVVGFVVGWRRVSPIQILYYHNGGYIILRYDFSTLLEEGKEVLIKEGGSL